jgi:hypothetical protein
MIRASVLALAMFAAACAPTSETPKQEPPRAGSPMPQTAEEATAQDTCGAAQYRALIGTNIAAVTLPSGPHIRVIQPGAPITQDFSPDRLNIMVDANGVITELQCF